jgi:hypothetical protein
MYAIIAAVLVVIIVIAAVLLITKGIPALKGTEEPTEVADAVSTRVPTFTPGPTKAPTNTPLPSATPTSPAFVMTDEYEVAFTYDAPGARPSTEWTGFFGQVFDSEGDPLADVSLIVLDFDGNPVELVDVPTSPVVKTDKDGLYEIRLAEGPYAETWSILVLTEEGIPASDFLSFVTDEDAKAGIQQVQVIWRQLP